MTNTDQNQFYEQCFVKSPSYNKISVVHQNLQSIWNQMNEIVNSTMLIYCVLEPWHRTEQEEDFNNFDSYDYKSYFRRQYANLVAVINDKDVKSKC